MKKIIYIICVLIAAMFSHNSAKASMLVNNLEEDVALYSAASDGLKGNVYTIATYKVFKFRKFNLLISDCKN